jgi:hypothetical protein
MTSTKTVIGRRRAKETKFTSALSCCAQAERSLDVESVGLLRAQAWSRLRLA